MDLEPLLISSKWEILSLLSSRTLSTDEIADSIGTSAANVSQQLRLLEAGDLVKKEVFRGHDIGKPKSNFSLAKNFGYVVSCMDGFSGKVLIDLDNYQQYVIKVWGSFGREDHYAMQKLYWYLEPFSSKIGKIAVKKDSDFYAYLECKGSVVIHPKLKFKHNGVSSVVNLKIVKKIDAEKLKTSFVHEFGGDY